MTREEAIAILKNRDMHGVPCGYTSGYSEALDMAIEALSEPSGDLISRADAVKELKKAYWDKNIQSAKDDPCVIDAMTDWAIRTIKALPSADAISREDTVTLNSPISISAEALQGWIPFTRRPMTEEEQKDYPNCTFMFDCVLPDDGDEILVSNGRFVWMDTFYNDIDGCYLDNDGDIDEDMAWMPLPKPYKGGDDE